MAARDRQLGRVYDNIKQVTADNTGLTDFQKKDGAKRLALMSKKVEEMSRSQDVHGLARILSGSSANQPLKHFYVLFHGGEQLFLTVTGKGRKIGMEGERLAKVVLVEAMGIKENDQLWMEELVATRGLQPLSWSGLMN